MAIAIVSTVSFLRQSEHHRSRLRLVSALPWELVLIGLSLLILQRLRGGGAVVVDRSLGTTAPSLLLFAFPIAFLAGFVALVARAAIVGPSVGARPERRLGHPRVPRGAPTRGALEADDAPDRGRRAVPRAVRAGADRGALDADHGGREGGRVRRERRAGADRQRERDPRPTFPLPVTRAVQRLLAGEFRPGVPFDLLAIDTETFASTAFWDPAFSPEPLETLLDRMSAPSGDALPVVMASAPNAFPDSITLDRQTLPIEIVGRATAFPGMTSLRPLVVVDARTSCEAFGTGPDPDRPGRERRALDPRDPSRGAPRWPSSTTPPRSSSTADEVKDIPYIAAVIDTFLVMNGLGVLAALLVFAAMLMYLQTRQRSEIVSYGLSLRMGMRSSRHLLAIAIEVGAMLVIAYVAGTVLALTAARLTVPLLDPIEAIPPDPITVVPVALVAIAAPALLLVALAGGWLTERRARSADLGQVMRLAD